MKKNLNVYVGAFLLTGALVAGGVALINDLPKHVPSSTLNSAVSQVQIDDYADLGCDARESVT